MWSLLSVNETEHVYVFMNEGWSIWDQWNKHLQIWVWETTIILTTVTWNNIYVGWNSDMYMQHHLLHILSTYRTDNIIPVFQDILGHFMAMHFF